MPSAIMPESCTPLSAVLPPLIFGTATFNNQYNENAYALPTTELVHEALRRGIRGFDTSPYYGPSEELLGAALSTPFVQEHFPRSSIFILTKCGRISGETFNYSPAWIRTSVERSLQRLRTSYLDVVYCHDVEFVSAEETLAAVQELRRIRDETGTLKYVGISGYPVDVLCDRAEMILRRTGEPLDIVQSYANYTLQNTKLLREGLPRFQAAQVEVVTNASLLGMGLLRRQGSPIGGQGDWHPAPDGLRKAVAAASRYCDEQGDKLEKVAIRYAAESWLHEGAVVGSRGDPASGIPWNQEQLTLNQKKLGVSVMGVSNLAELEETMRVWHSILDTVKNGDQPGAKTGRQDRDWSIQRGTEVRQMAKEIKRILGSWYDYTWPSPDEDYVKRNEKRLLGSS